MEVPAEVFKQEGFVVICAAAGAAFLSECVSYLLFFSSVSFQTLHQDIIQLSRKLDRQHRQLDDNLSSSPSAKTSSPSLFSSSSSSTSGSRKSAALERELQKKHRDAASTRQSAHLLSAVVFMVLMPYFYSRYEGLVVARLPIEPIFPFRLMTHATLSGQDFTECSFTFLFTTTMFLVKTCLQRFLGYAPPPGSQSKGPGGFGAMAGPTA
eukprot:GHVS01026471.1.p1 GENE.GHVS01026471.1~~GHVS01026471.1.p1  ORF type:complete len:210 (+),score=43.27 GHVS01026471.1:474-1103(+)